MTLEKLQQTAIDAIGRYRQSTGADRTEFLREAARAMAEARGHFFREDGEADWTGSSAAFRAWSREVMTWANVPASEVSALQSLLRYHAGNALREILTRDQLEHYGLAVDSPRERQANRHRRASDTLSLFGPGAAGKRIRDTGDIVAALETIEDVLIRIDPPSEPEQLLAVRKAAVGVQLLAERIAQPKKKPDGSMW